MSGQDPNVCRNPHRINEPRTLAFWPVHHVAPTVFLIALGVITSEFMLLTTVAIVWFFGIRHIEHKYAPGYLLSRMYWNGIAVFLKTSKSFPDPMKREYHQ